MNTNFSVYTEVIFCINASEGGLTQQQSWRQYVDHKLHMRHQYIFIKDVTLVLGYIERRIIYKVYKVVLLFLLTLEKTSFWFGAPQLEKDSDQLD